MKSFSKYYYFAFLLITLTFTTGVQADVKIKLKQTSSGQTYENTTYIKGKRQRSESMNGMMVSLTQCDLRRSVQINPQAQTYIINMFDQAADADNQKASTNQKDGVVRAGGTITTTTTVKDTGETKKMFGYMARHLIFTMETVSSPDACTPLNSKMEIDGWYIDAAFGLDCEMGRYSGYTRQQKDGCTDKHQSKQIGNAKRGYPVYEKMTFFDDKGQPSFSTINEVIELSNTTLDSALFEIPADYREVKNSTELYAASNSMTMNGSSSSIQNSSSKNSSNSSSLANIKNQAPSTSISSTVEPKKEGVVRIGLAGVKTGAVGEGMNAQELASAIQNTLGEYLKGTNIELVPIEAKLSTAIESEAKQKECDYIVYSQVSHKKGGGGGGFGNVFGKVIAPAVGSVGLGHTGSVAGNIAGQVATSTIVTAGAMASNVKSKDEITVDAKLQVPGNSSPVLSKQAKVKAKSDGEDIISPAVEQIAQAIFSAVSK